jgi:hypothetical protein
MSAPIFIDIGKTASDVFADDFDLKYTLKIKTPAPAGVVITTNTQYDSAKDTKLITKISGKYVHSSGFTFEKLEMASNGALTTETSLVGAAPGLKLEFKGNDSNKGDLSFTYSVAALTATGELDVVNFDKLSGSVASVHGPFVGGLGMDFSISKKTLASVNATVGYTMSDVFAAYLKSSKQFSEFALLTSIYTIPNTNLSFQGVYSKGALSGILAAAYKCTPKTTVKAKATSAGVVSASLKHVLDKKFTVTAAAETPSNFKSIKFGVSAVLG